MTNTTDHCPACGRRTIHTPSEWRLDVRATEEHTRAGWALPATWRRTWHCIGFVETRSTSNREVRP